ncbi:hypothetical protein BTZ20_0373 [Rhodococcus sp. MTM3W5.2]|nr:hypothetical protein BTZ20_0373 [Rhodococcus sp. MTM3W5.2]
MQGAATHLRLRRDLAEGAAEFLPSTSTAASRMARRVRALVPDSGTVTVDMSSR